MHEFTQRMCAWLVCMLERYGSPSLNRKFSSSHKWLKDLIQSVLDIYLKNLTSHFMFRFPPRTFGKQSPVQCSFQSSWFRKWQWLYCNVAQDASFLVDSYTNWKDATIKFAKHESSDFHKACAEALSSTVHIGDILNKQAVTE